MLGTLGYGRPYPPGHRPLAGLRIGPRVNPEQVCLSTASVVAVASSAVAAVAPEQLAWREPVLMIPLRSFA